MGSLFKGLVFTCGKPVAQPACRHCLLYEARVQLGPGTKSLPFQCPFQILNEIIRVLQAYADADQVLGRF